MAKILEELAELEQAEKTQIETPEEENEEELSQDDNSEEDVTSADAENDNEEDQEEDQGEDEQEEKAEEPKQETQESDEDFRVRKNEYYKMRREKQKLERENTELKQAHEPQESDDDDLLAEVKREVMMKRALKEFTDMEANFVSEAGVDDYDDVTAQYRQAVYNSLRVMNPNKSHQSLLDETREAILMQASQHVQAGHDPIAELYFAAKKLGFGKIPKEEAKEEEKKETPKADLKTVAKNKKRSAGMAGAGAGGKPEITAEAAASMSPAEFAKLSKEDKDKFLRSN